MKILPFVLASAAVAAEPPDRVSPEKLAGHLAKQLEAYQANMREQQLKAQYEQQLAEIRKATQAAVAEIEKDLEALRKDSKAGADCRLLHKAEGKQRAGEWACPEKQEKK